MLHKCSSYWAGRGLGGPGRAADAVAVVSVVRGQAGWAGRERGGHREGTARRGWLGCTLLGGAAAVTAVVAVLELAKNQIFACRSSSLGRVFQTGFFSGDFDIHFHQISARLM